MIQASAGRRPPGRASSDRRLGAGIAISVLLHGLLLSLQFGVPGLDLGGGGPISVTLAPSPQPAASLPDTPPAPTPPPPATVPVQPTPPAPSRGMRLVDLPPPSPTVQAEARPPAQARRPKRTKPPAPKRRLREVPAPVIVAAPNQESEFTVPVPLPDIVPDADLEAPVMADIVETETPASPAEVEDAGPDLIALEEEQARQRQLAEQALEQERLAQAELDASEARLAQERLAQERLEQERLAHERLAQERLAQERAAAQDTLIAQQREAARRQAEELAAREQAQLLRQQELAERQRNEELAQQRQAEVRAQQLAEQLAREQAEQLARQQAEQLAQQQAAQQAAQQARADAERLARQQADEAARQAAAQRMQAQASSAGEGAAGMDSMPVGPGAGAGRGAGSGAGSQPGAGSLAGLPGNRARELLRGVTIPNVAAPATPAERAMGGRRVVADGGERDAPLRLYVDSVRQKLERNSVMGGARLALQDVRIDPLVSLSLRSDGSVDEVTIIRSSGRAEVDDAVRRFVRLNARYSAFPPNVAAHFDVIEIRRIWRFGDGLKLVEEMR